MRTLAIFAAVAAASFGLFATEAEAKKGRRTAAVVGAVTGLAAGALIAGAVSSAQAAPQYSYGPSPQYVPGPAYRPAYGSTYGYAPAPAYSTYGVAPAYGTVVVLSRPRFDDFEDDCRIIVRRKVNSWGEVVTRREEVCY